MHQQQYSDQYKNIANTYHSFNALAAQHPYRDNAAGSLPNGVKMSAVSQSDYWREGTKMANPGAGNFMKIEGAGDLSQSADLQVERGFENTRYDIARNTKEMVNKIFKAASSNNQ